MNQAAYLEEQSIQHHLSEIQREGTHEYHECKETYFPYIVPIDCDQETECYEEADE